MSKLHLRCGKVLMGETAFAGQQHLRALELANRVRLARAALKRQIAEGELSVVDIVLDPPWQAQRMPISTLLQSQKRWGHTRCRRMLMSIGVSENKPVGTLTERQRMALAKAMSGNAPRSSRATDRRVLTPA